ncbi:MAG TPA: hypothetical protein DCS63_03720 [Elusimicrobia bacterium]|nr:hypothetical protein [Elusimicrobiota bacterium]
MNKNTRTTTTARHCYAVAYTNYLRSGNLEEATRQVAHDIYVNRGTSPGTQQGDWQEAERITREWPHTITEASQAHLFDKALAKTRQWLKEIELELGFNNPNDAYRALRSVLHAVRDRLPVKECAEFASQLPIMIVGMYYTGWTPMNKPEKMRTMDEFMDHVGAELPSGMDPLRVTQGVINVIERHVSAGEIKDVRRNFPEHLRELWEEVSEKSRR